MQGIFLLLSACFFWGLSFAGTRWVTQDFSPISAHCIRFFIAGTITLPFLIYRKGFKNFKGVFICSILLMAGIQIQTIGITLTTLAKSGFFTVFYIIFIPLLTILFYKQKLRKEFWLLILVALIGVSLMCDLNIMDFNTGDLLILIAAFLLSLHIIAIDKYAKNIDPVNFNFFQCFLMGIYSTPLILFFDRSVDLSPLLTIKSFSFPSPLYGLITTAILSSIVAFSLQVVAQKKIPPHIVGVIFLSEAVFAALFGYLFFKELLSLKAMLGAFIILLVVALVPKYSKVITYT